MNRFISVFVGLALFVGVADAQKMYKWVDDHGNVTYQDKAPPGGEFEAYAEDEELIAEQERAADPSIIAQTNYPVTLYSIPVCDACDLVRNVLQTNGVPFSEKNASENVTTQDELRNLAGQLSVPVLTIGGSVVYGYSSTRIKEELLSAGYSIDGEAGRVPEETDEVALSPEEVENEALRAAEELTSELEELEDDSEFLDDLESAEEIPDDEEIKVQIGG